ncbi:iron-hydroxamate ABC transporter substrate-binding protein [Virgibacillus sp. MG-45]|uniref:iron-hydroxamate ABC transporter substrate-binding protein n=1 Tax=Virgibacillus sp. MG-45 TaxID=3102791 RepID=UPI002EDA028F
MRKIVLFIAIITLTFITACNSAQENKEKDKKANEAGDAQETIVYESETGPIEVPANPERVVVLSSFIAGSVMASDVNIVGIDSWSNDNPRYEPYLQDAKEVSEESLEQILELNPDLIIATPDSKNLDKLKEIAPTVTYTYGKVDYLTQYLEVGKLLNKEKQAKAWIADFKKRAQEAGEKIKAKIGENTTISVIELFDKQLYVYGDNWGRGTEILYQEMGLKMPEKVKEDALKDGYFALSPEVVPEYAGDYMVFSKNSEQDNSFQETETYKNIPAVKNGRVFEVDGKAFYFNDPITLDFQLEFFTEKFLGE